MTNDVDFPNLHTCYKTCLGHGASKKFHCTIYRLTACLIETDFVSRKKNNVFMYIAFSTKRRIKKIFDRNAICLKILCMQKAE